MGYPIREAIPAMGSVIFDMDDLDWTLNEFVGMRDAGFQIVKAGWGMWPEAVFGDDAARDLRYLAAVREVIGEDLSLLVDTREREGSGASTRRSTAFAPGKTQDHWCLLLVTLISSIRASESSDR